MNECDHRISFHNSAALSVSETCDDHIHSFNGIDDNDDNYNHS